MTKVNDHNQHLKQLNQQLNVNFHSVNFCNCVWKHLFNGQLSINEMIKIQNIVMIELKQWTPGYNWAKQLV